MADTGQTLLLSTVRDEGPYILEWLAYHRAIGFDRFLIYTNDCRDGSDLMLDRLAALGEVVHERNVVLKRGPQKSAYKAAMQHPEYLRADWVFAGDADEFLNIRAGKGMLADLIAAYPKADAIPVTWRLFSHGGQEALPVGLITETLIDAQPAAWRGGDKGRFVKSLFRPHPDMKRIGSHAPVYEDAAGPGIRWGAPWLDVAGETDPRRPMKVFGYETAQVNHYAVRTVDSFLLKRDRGDVNLMKDRLELEYWQRWCVGGEEDRSIQRHLPAVRAELERLLDDPVLRALHGAAQEVHKRRLRALLGTSEVSALKQKIVSDSAVQTGAADAPVGQAAEAELRLRAPKRHLNRLKLLREMPKSGRCAEIGVWNGGFSAAILDETTPAELVLIDPWDLLSDQSSDEMTHGRHSDHGYMRSMYDNVSAAYSNLENVTIRRGFSAEVLAQYPDGYFDWVYIDGNHLYDFVRTDVAMCFRKVRPGGTIAGDDFFWKRDGRMHVKEAVLDEMRAQGMTNRPTRFGQQFFFQVGV
ncbi:glycosyltransferase family 2 protein [uncultured Roseobacter sp.]|uniref:glycosyltransferase family 2 protein n=1 Tax=uncultured Roseobacter sp. TaxID=114847 RepID=UPI00263713E7|nr:glycosyltransferase family 2 protein [uncultured Roseobacter sp.]